MPLVISLLLLAAACGDGGNTGPASSGDGSEVSGGESEPSDGGGGEQASACEVPEVSGDVEVAAVWTGAEQKNFEAVLDNFAQKSGASVNYTSTGDDIAAVLGTQIEGGKPPDVAVLPQPGLLRDLAKEGSLKPIEEFAGAQIDEAYAPVWRDLATVDGELHGVWFKAANKSTWWYNVGAFEQAGVEPPTDWDQLQEVAGTLTASGVAPFSIGAADGWVLTDWFENVYLRTAGAETYEKLASHEIEWTDESVATALERLGEVWGNDDWVAGGASGALQTDFPTSVNQTFADPPDAATVYEGDFVSGIITEETQAELGADADFFEFPAIDGSPPSVVGAGDAAVLLTDNEAASALIAYLACAEAAEIWAKAGGFTSPNKQVDVSVYPDDISRRSAEALANAEAFQFDLSDLQPAAFGGTVGQGMFQLFQDFLRNPDDVEGIQKKLEAAAAKAFK
jgi:ABC-type molybdate transport system substrate-binding protein